MCLRILVPIDGGATAQRALQEAVKLARDGVKLRLVYVVEEPQSLYPYGAVDYAGQFEAVRQTGERALAEAATEVYKSGITAETARK